MKVSILSMQRINNYGSLLQAYSLKKIIESLGNQVEFIDIKRGENQALNDQCEKLVLHNDEKSRNWFVKQIIRVKNKFSNLEAKKHFEQFRIDKLEISNTNNDTMYDVCVIGSDEVFNCLQKSKWGFDSQLFGNVKNAKKVITYAACCGSTKVEDLSEELRTAIVAAMDNLKSISVRDENTAKFARILTGKECNYNLDPVAVGDFSEEIKNIDLKGKVPKRYCIVYAYKDRISDENTINAIKKYCKKYNLVPIAPFGKQKWIKNMKPLTPFELLKAFENAECIVTDTFHGTIFGAKFSKKLAVIIRDSNRNKLEDLTKRLGIEGHILTDINELEKILSIELDRAGIDCLLKDARKEAFNYLEGNLYQDVHK
ncbi:MULTISPECIES: polysaccharide pyruvyl transferase family protein [unclassified Amedibacterium]|uniref:polysaccharide pyruvyl transferase family protein n=1 Tax=unclassified Amedibacterium TaxID=3088137 RepID=UPI000E3F114C|nr:MULTISPECIES: polysaccharide pyruvyl transferase family protein [unclassified Absiella]RGB65531.1 polysaccharide pyruvyl transferase family protein [Absiella sp. AM09-45]RGB74517.1 polysaccharide pyruvyl transferase family protein [Absiella sp. AM09-50]RGC53202.1 polysaccharide pyruvyl transferase family protein [Absiella sp. AM29-15]